MGVWRWCGVLSGKVVPLQANQGSLSTCKWGAGATGLVGSKLVSRLTAQGDTVRVLTRNTDNARRKLPPRNVDFVPSEHWEAALSGCDAVVNLAGEPIATRCVTLSHTQLAMWQAAISVGMSTLPSLAACAVHFTAKGSHPKQPTSVLYEITRLSLERGNLLVRNASCASLRGAGQGSASICSTFCYPPVRHNYVLCYNHYTGQ